MTFALPESWVWDFWVVDDGTRYHLFFLYASKALRDPEARHYRASIGHALSDDLVRWERTVDALVRSDAPAFDDLATWTGSVAHGPDGLWYLFYTGATLTEAGNVQSIGLATSPDLFTWDRQGKVLEADPRWYEKLIDQQWHDEAFRDPWVYRDGNQWRMLITARSNHGPADDRGVIGTAVSNDLRNWSLLPPLSTPGAGFGQLEVMETVRISGREFLVFNCVAKDLSEAHRAREPRGGVWLVPTPDDGSAWDPSAARLLADARYYVGRILEDREGRSVMLAFDHEDDDGRFIGTISDPMPLDVLEDGTVELAGGRVGAH